MPTNRVNLLDVNPLERITGDVAISQFNYESIMNGLVQWDQSHNDNITIRLATRTDPYFVDYTIPTKYFYDKNYGTINSAVLLEPKAYAYKNRVKLPVSIEDPVTLRINAVDVGDTKWRLYEEAIVYDEFDYEEYKEHEVLVENAWLVKSANSFKHSYDKAGLYFRIYDMTSQMFVMYETLEAVETDEPIASGDAIGADTDGYIYRDNTPIAKRVCVHTMRQMPDSNAFKFYFKYMASDTAHGTIYSKEPNRQANPSTGFDNPLSGYAMYCYAHNIDETYHEGEMVYCLGDFYVSLSDTPSVPPAIISVPDQSIDDYVGYHLYQVYATEWARTLLLPFDNNSITGSGVIRMTANTDISAFVLRNIGKNESSEKTSISVMGTIAIIGTETDQTTGVNIVSTSNYANWPEFTATKWNEGASYQTNASLSAFDKQDYSAVMVFKHYGDDDNYRYKNIINYDGPDVDQGLCILLPVTISDENNVTHDPADGCMLDFMFNIWPNHKYDGRPVNDLIINKSQIYVYSVPDYSEYKLKGFNVNTVEPIAKFSMARLVNFHVFNENIGVPDRPTVYKARFIYSKKEKRWKTYDYYQLPDHIFLSPHGFVDPSDPKAYSVQTAGFPLFQNPFSDFDLSAVHVDSTYRNQIQNPDISTEE